MTTTFPVFVRPAWFDQAACHDSSPALFFAEHGENATIAVAVCRGCPVRLDCLEFAVGRHEPWGVWGGLSPRQRQRIVMARRRAYVT